VAGRHHIPQVSYYTTLLHAGVVAGIGCLAVFIPLSLKPYSHTVDNLSLASALLVISMSLFASWHASLSHATGTAIAVFAAIPVLEAIVAALLVTGSALHWHSATAAKLLKRVIPNWGKNSAAAPESPGTADQRSKGAYMGCMHEDETASVLSGHMSEAEKRDLLRHAVNAVIIPENKNAKARKVRLQLPAELKPEAVQVKLREPYGQVGVGRGAEDLSAKLDFPMPSRLLFKKPATGNEFEKAAETPFAALLSEDDGDLVYDKAQFNDLSLPWEEVVKNFFRKHPDIGRDAKAQILEQENLHTVPLLEITACTR
jgi:hypothetical protein